MNASVFIKIMNFCFYLNKLYIYFLYYPNDLVSPSWIMQGKPLKQFIYIFMTYKLLNKIKFIIQMFNIFYFAYIFKS